MNRQEILDMVAGKELNAKISTELFKYELDESETRFRISCNKASWLSVIPSYSESMDSAMLIVELLRKNGIYLTIDIDLKTYTVFAYVTSDKYLERIEGKLLPELICKVALLCNMYDFVTLEV